MNIVGNTAIIAHYFNFYHPTYKDKSMADLVLIKAINHPIDKTPKMCYNM
jgi:hypothetical protein